MNHKAQNNLHIIHWDENGKYMCNQAVNPSNFKMTKIKARVTCVNCLKRLSNREQRK